MNKKVVYSIALSKETGCIVMIRTRGKQVEVMGSMTREDSLKFADGVIDWDSDERNDAPEAAGPISRPAYPH